MGKGVFANMKTETVGLIFAVTSLLFYTASGGLQRCLTGNEELDLAWTVAVKETVTVLCVAPVALAYCFRRKYRFPGWKAFGLLALAGVTCQAFGSLPHLWGYRTIGLALTTPLLQSIQLIFSIVGALCLREHITRSKYLALLLLIGAVLLLGFGGKNGSISGQEIRMGLGLAFVCTAAAGYCAEQSLLRHVLKFRDESETTPKENASLTTGFQRVPTTLTILVVSTMGVLICGGYFTLDKGVDAWRGIEPDAWKCAIATGFTNVVGFVCQIEGLRRLFMLKSTLISAAQTATLCLVGVLLFNEPFGWTTASGVLLVLAGVIVSALSK